MKKIYAHISAAGFAAMLILPGFSQESFLGKFEELRKQLPTAPGESRVTDDIRAVSNTGDNQAPAGSIVKTGNVFVSVSVDNRLGGNATTSTSSIAIIMEVSTSTESVIKKVIEAKKGAATSIQVGLEARAETSSLDRATTAVERSVIHSLDERGSRVTAELEGGVKGVISRIKSYISYVFSIFTGQKV